MKYIIVGAGKNGIALLKRLGRDSVSFFADNNVALCGKTVEGIEVISVASILNYLDSNRIIVSIEDKTQIKEQLEELGIMDYSVYLSDWRRESLTRSVLEEKSEDEKRINHHLNDYCILCDSIDPIYNIEGFKDIVKQCKNDTSLNGCFNIQGRDWESLTYGHFHELIKYSSIKDANSCLFPIIPHAPFFFDNLRTFSSATFFSSPYLKQENNKLFPYIPSFVIGEYMQYVLPDDCDNPYSSNSVVVFLHHSVESIKVMHQYDYLMDSIFMPLMSRYENIYLSVYWYDVDDELYTRIQKSGIKIVSAGFRFDERFISRLRKIISMCDDIVVYGRTSALIYALSMGKRLFYYKEILKQQYMDSNINHRFLSRKRTEAISSWEDVIVKNFGRRYSEYSDEDKRIVDFYFGLSVRREPYEIQMIYDICKDIWDNSNFMEERYPMAVYETYWKYQTNGVYDKLTMLSEALPAGFWNL